VRLNANRKIGYASTREFANDLRNPTSVGVTERSEPRTWKVRRSPRIKIVFVYTGLAMIPVVVFILLLIAARSR
jgi:hypothetical protein